MKPAAPAHPVEVERRLRQLRSTVRKYDTDPPSAKSTRAPVLDGDMFDQARLQDAIAKGLVDALPPLDYPNDDLLVSTVVAHGMPRWSAEQMRNHPGLRFAFVRFWLDVGMAAKGDHEAQERVDVCRATWDEMRQVELIHDRPDMSVGFWER